MKFPLLTLLLLVNLSATAATSSNQHPPVDLAPDARLQYSVKADYSGFPVVPSGTAEIHWTDDPHKQTYTINSSISNLGAAVIISSNSHGWINSAGLVPTCYGEKPFAKSATQTSINNPAKPSASPDCDKATTTLTYQEGDQDRLSVIWQLIALVRANPAKFSKGTEWTVPVIGASNKGSWTFKVEATDAQLKINGKDETTIHITRNSGNNRLSLWLAPRLSYYPVRLTFVDDKLTIDQVFTGMGK